jgi:hypothetical protein
MTARNTMMSQICYDKVRHTCWLQPQDNPSRLGLSCVSCIDETSTHCKGRQQTGHQFMMLLLLVRPSSCATRLLPWLQVVDSLKRGYQVMVFVHSRKDTGKTGRVLADLAAKAGECSLFESEGDDPRRGLAVRDVNK